MKRNCRRANHGVRTLCVWAVAWLAMALVQAQSTTILNSPHNLSASGPGSVKATGEPEVCVFCHIPHNASPDCRPLWNRSAPVAAYTVYASTSLNALPGQPTGSSKLCLSCHDGTIAIGSVLSSRDPITMTGGVTTMPLGATHLGTDLSDDHPISFRYDDALAVSNRKLKPPSLLPETVKLDAQQELQCTSCHDAHDNRWGKFLTIDNTASQLCETCHRQGNTTVAAHSQCTACHRQHGAPSGAHLLKATTETETCLACHSGQPGTDQGANIATHLEKMSRHTEPLNVRSQSGPNDVPCSACHEPHTIASGTASAPVISPRLGEVSGIDSSGAAVARAQYEHEVCFKCHGSQARTSPLVSRQVVQNDTRLEFAPSALSYHPLQAAGKNLDVPSLRPGLSAASLIYCTDCHAADGAGDGSRGPHGATNRPLLVDACETVDNTAESAATYALCYRCHERTSILSNRSFSSHSKHIVDYKTPCTVCHDSHGIASVQGTATNHAHLINFDTTVVRPDPLTQRLEYRSTGTRQGECALLCHNAPHSPWRYP